jgi:glycosyltransferase involved in cell wall biosynthesis
MTDDDNLLNLETYREACRLKSPHKIKVLHYYPDFGQMGGLESTLLAFMRQLLESPTIDAVLVCTQGSQLYTTAQGLGIRVLGVSPISMLAKPMLRFLDWRSQGQLRTILAEEDPDISHLHIGHLENSPFWQHRSACILTLHGYGTLYQINAQEGGFKTWVKSQFRKIFCESMSHYQAITVVSEYERQRLTQAGYLPPENRAEVLYNGISLEAFEEDEDHPERKLFLRATLHLPKEATLVLFCSRLDPIKCPLDFVAFAQHLQASSPERSFHFLMIGEGPLRGAVEKAISKSGLHAQFTLLEFQSQVAGYFQAADLYVHTAQEEGFGRTVLEAMASKTLICGYHVGALPEIIALTPYPLLTPYGSPETLAEKALFLLALSEHEQLKIKTTLFKRAQHFDEKRYVEEMTALYQRGFQE